MLKTFWNAVKVSVATDVNAAVDVFASLLMRLPFGQQGQHSWAVAPGTPAQNV